MNKSVIKVIKRDEKDGKRNTQVLVNSSKREATTQIKVAHIVNNWISERFETSRTEKDFSDSKILEWKLIT